MSEVTSDYLPADGGKDGPWWPALLKWELVESWYVSLEWDFIHILLFLASVHGFMYETSDFCYSLKYFVHSYTVDVIFYSFLLKYPQTNHNAVKYRAQSISQVYTSYMINCSTTSPRNRYSPGALLGTRVSNSICNMTLVHRRCGLWNNTLGWFQ